MNYKSYKEEFRQTVARMNVAVDHNDRNRNLTEYGRLQVLADVLKDMGHVVDGNIIAVDSNMFRAIYITLDGESLGNFTGNVNKSLFEVITPEDLTQDPEDSKKE